MTQRVVVVGATGQIGQPLCDELVQSGHDLVVFSRDAAAAKNLVPGAASYVGWNPAELSQQCIEHLGVADAVIYLAGAPLFDGRRQSQRDVVAESHARASALGRFLAAIGRLDRRPGVLVAASSVGYYGYAAVTDEPVAEDHQAGSDWWGQASSVIEQAALEAQAHGVRTVVMRTGYVLSQHSMASQLTQFRHHLGGWVGAGRGWTPWIHCADQVGIIAFALQHPDLDGPINLVAPEPVRTRDFARTLGHTVSRRAWLPVPTPLVRMGLGVIADILVRGKRVVPGKVSAAGYTFRFPILTAALDDLLVSEPDSTARAA